ncbi:MAG: YMGG-like glycine zipper-containing protein [Hyphomonadaceae bacterium]
MRGQALFAVGAIAAALMAAQPAAAQNYSQNYGGYGYQGQPYQAQYQGGYVSPQETLGQAQCRNSKTNRMLGGAAIGAILGAVIGNNVGHDAGRNTLPGAVLGGVAGGAIGRGTANCSNTYQQGYGAPTQPYGYQQGYRGGDPRYDDSGLAGGPGYAPSSYRNAGGYDGQCRWGDVTMRDPDGRAVHRNVYMCRDRNGEWRPQN